MRSTNENIFLKLSGDPILLSYLAENPPFYNRSSTTKNKQNSIIPADMAVWDLATPFITIQEGVETKLVDVLTQTFYIRVYNDERKSYVEINTILDRIRELLDHAEFVLDDRRHVSTEMESRLAGLVAQDHNLKFKEEIYRVIVL